VSASWKLTVNGAARLFIEPSHAQCFQRIAYHPRSVMAFTPTGARLIILMRMAGILYSAFLKMNDRALRR
jgi:hypothetical protein